MNGTCHEKLCSVELFERVCVHISNAAKSVPTKYKTKAAARGLTVLDHTEAITSAFPREMSLREMWKHKRRGSDVSSEAPAA